MEAVRYSNSRAVLRQHTYHVHPDVRPGHRCAPGPACCLQSLSHVAATCCASTPACDAAQPATGTCLLMLCPLRSFTPIVSRAHGHGPPRVAWSAFHDTLPVPAAPPAGGAPARPARAGSAAPGLGPGGSAPTRRAASSGWGWAGRPPASGQASPHGGDSPAGARTPEKPGSPPAGAQREPPGGRQGGNPYPPPAGAQREPPASRLGAQAGGAQAGGRAAGGAQGMVPGAPFGSVQGYIPAGAFRGM